jgi:hypothetical protein
MPEYDPNLPQEFTRMPKRPAAAGVAIAAAAAAGLVTLALYALTHSMPPMTHDTVANHQEGRSNAAPAVQKDQLN